MAKSKTLVSVILMAISVVHTARAGIDSAQPNEVFDSKSQENMQWRQYDLGSRLGQSLLRGCSVFIGTVKAIKTPAVDSTLPKSAVPTVADVNVTADEWLWGDVSARRPDWNV